LSCAGFLVDNIDEAKAEMEAEGIEFTGPIGYAKQATGLTLRALTEIHTR